MFYSGGNDSYMQDLYYYNQMPNSAFMNGFGNNMIGNSTMQPVMQGGMSNNQANQMFMNSGMFPNANPMQNLSNMYPSIYRILNPVISRIVSNNNQLITEDLLNNMTDTVFNIVEGQIDFGDDQVQGNNNRNDNQSISTNTSNITSNNNSSNRNAESARQNNQNVQTSNARHTRNDSLFRDLIKILIIKELLSRNQIIRHYRK